MCGRRNIEGVGGVKINYPDHPVRKTQFGEWPHMCAVLKFSSEKEGVDNDYEYLCGASLIAKNVVLTSAHYVRPYA